MSEVTIKNLSSGKVLSIVKAGKGATLRQCSGTGRDVTQWWRLVPVTGHKHQYSIQNVVSGMVLEVAGGSSEDQGRVSLWEANGETHQRWRLIPVGEGRHEYAIINVHSGKALDLWDGMWRDDAQFAQVEYWHGMQQRWMLSPGDADTAPRAVLTIVRNESVFLPIWIRYYRQFFPARDMYVIDHQSTDGSTDGDGFTCIPVSRTEYSAGWQRDIVQWHQNDLVDRYDVVLCTDVDEIVAPDPRLGDLGTYINQFDNDFVTCQGYEILHQKNHEPPFDPTVPVLKQRSTWYANPLYSKPLLARVPMMWKGGCHDRVDGRENKDPNLYLIHLHRMDYGICLARHRDRTRFPLAQIDRDRGWGYQNQITDPAKFVSWFFHDSCGPVPPRPEPIPPWWSDVV